MAYRQSRQELRSQLAFVNRLLVQAGINKQFQITHRYDYYGLDVTNLSGDMLSGPKATGTFSHCVDHAYIEALNLIADKHWPDAFTPD